MVERAGEPAVASETVQYGVSPMPGFQMRVRASRMLPGWYFASWWWRPDRKPPGARPVPAL